MTRQRPTMATERRRITALGGTADTGVAVITRIIAIIDQKQRSAWPKTTALNKGGVEKNIAAEFSWGAGIDAHLAKAT